MQVGEQDRGELQVNVTDSDNAPIRDARVTISEPETAINPNSPIERLETDVSGQTQIVDLNTPPLEYSLNENNENMPYANYNIQIEAPGYETENISNVEILPDSLSLQDVRMRRREGEQVEKKYASKYPRVFKRALSVELLEEHQAFFEGCRK